MKSRGIVTIPGLKRGPFYTGDKGKRVTQVRILTADDAAAYQAVRLRSLREHPEAFGSSTEEEGDTPIEKTAAFLATAAQGNPMFGAFVDNELVGLIYLSRPQRNK